MGFAVIYNIPGRHPLIHHKSPEDARADARRLAEANPKETFYVLTQDSAFLSAVAGGKAAQFMEHPHPQRPGISVTGNSFEDLEAVIAAVRNPPEA